MTGLFRRFDATLGAIEEIDNGRGGIRVDARLARSGIQVYRNDDGTERREYRDPREVFAQDALSSFADATLTVGHPGIIDGDDWRTHAVGHIRDARQDGDTFVAGKVVVKDRPTIDAIKSRKLRELSVGYLTEYDPTPGVAPNGERFDGVQKRIRANHVALLPQGHARGGSDLVLRLDSKGNELPAFGDERTERASMETIRIDGTDYPLGTEAERKAAAAAQVRWQAKLDAERADAATKLAAETKRADAATALATETKTRLDSTTAELATTKTQLAEAIDPKRLDARVAERTAVIAGARAILGAEAKFDGKTDAEIRRETVAKAMPAVKLDGKSDDAISALYEAAVAASPRTDADPLGDINRTVPVARHDGASPREDGRGEPNEFAAAKRSQQQIANLWKGAQPATQTPAPAGR